MRFLICGIGSIGQRHYKNLQRLGHEVAIFRSGKSTGYNRPFVEKFFEEQNNTDAPVKAFSNFEEALAVFRPDAVFVTNPNSRHMEVALPAARAGKHLFIEKPVSGDLSGIAELEDLQQRHAIKIMVGYNLRFHPLLARMKAMYGAGAIGKALSAHAEVGESIEDWHPWEDYRASYAPWKKDGGGVARCFSHDIDYLYWFFGKPEKIMAAGGKMSPLEGDAEDMVKSLWEYKSGVIVSLHLDYWQRPACRTFEIIGTTGALRWDYHAGTLMLQPHEKESKAEAWYAPEGFDRNDTFVAETEDFVSAVRENREPAIPLRQGREVLEIVLAITRQLKI